ncbi:MAG: DUF983 domain-containing protein [Rhodospirillales bacterium]|nr:DUF983 domain-containing protein [Rhodospirillales bacterium]MCB9964761.1 DUF983 domain-containing protein [Rhodospirillales bacterium]MCB9973761.1 DUF983 domain-containing protein [Rhodospirillales bacterium]MCB9980659.1 DUF983 domain-containing protein [Rhodospirillales bacterium]
MSETPSGLNIFTTGLKCVCPRCQTGALYKSKEFLSLNEVCPSCGLDLKKCDSADGPAVFLIFLLGFLLVPLALLLEVYVAPPLWVHAILWSILALGLTIGALRPLKATIIALQYKHLPWQ